MTSKPVTLPQELTELREYHAKAACELRAFADDHGLRESDVKHYRKRAAAHEAFVATIEAARAELTRLKHNVNYLVDGCTCGRAEGIPRETECAPTEAPNEPV